MQIEIETTVEGHIENVWAAWTQPEHIVCWNFASDDWHCPAAEVDLKIGGRFKYRMETKDGSSGFDFEGTFTDIERCSHLGYILDDDRVVNVQFLDSPEGITIREVFDAEDEFNGEQQRLGWLSILSNFKRHVESSAA